MRRFESASQRITRVEHPSVVPLLGLLAGAGPGRHGQPPHDRRHTSPNASPTAASLRPTRWRSSRPSPPAWRRRTATASCTDGSGRRTSCSTTRPTPTSPTSASTRSAPAWSRSPPTAYDAPERLGGCLATPAADVYSLGVLLQQLLSGTPPPLDRPLPTGRRPRRRGDRAAPVGRPFGAPGDGRRPRRRVREALAVAADPAPTFAPARNPYRGLEAFEQADAGDFFGREHAVAEMVGVLADEHLLVVVGPSGIGKSSVVKAGLVPALRRGAVAGSETLVGHRDGARTITVRAARRRARTRRHRRGPRLRRRDHDGRLPARRHRRAAAAGGQRRRRGRRPVRGTVHRDDRRAGATGVHGRARRRGQPAKVRPSASSPRCAPTTSIDRSPTPRSATPSRGRTVALGAMTATELAEAIRRPAAAVGVEVDAALDRADHRRGRAATGRAPARATCDGGAVRTAADEHDHARRPGPVRWTQRCPRSAGRGDLRRPRRVRSAATPAGCS